MICALQWYGVGLSAQEYLLSSRGLHTPRAYRARGQAQVCSSCSVLCGALDMRLTLCLLLQLPDYKHRKLLLVEGQR